MEGDLSDNESPKVLKECDNNNNIHESRNTSPQIKSRGIFTKKPKVPLTGGVTRATPNLDDNKSKIPRRENSRTNARNTRMVPLIPPEDKRFTLKHHDKTAAAMKSDESRMSKKQESSHILERSSTALSSSTTISTAAKTVRLGQIPSYLKKKTCMDPKISSKEKAFIALKKRISEEQHELLVMFNSLSEAYRRANLNLSVEPLRLVSVAKNEYDDLLLIGKDGLVRRSDDLDDFVCLQKLEGFQKRFREAYEIDLKLCENLFGYLRQITETETTVGDCTVGKLAVEDLLRPTIEEFRNQNTALRDLLDDFDTFSESFYVGSEAGHLRQLVREKEDKIAELMQQIEENAQNPISPNVETDDFKVEMEELKILMNSKEDQSNELRKNIEELKELNTKILVNFEEAQNEIKEKDLVIGKLQLDLELAKAKSEHKEALDQANRQNSDVVDLLKRQEAAEDMYEKERQKCLCLEKQVEDLMSLVEELKLDVEKERITTSFYQGERGDKELIEEIANLRANINKLIQDNACLEKERNELQTVLQETGHIEEIMRAREEIDYLTKTNSCLKAKIEKLEQTLTSKNAIIKDLEQDFHYNNNMSNTPSNKTYQNELITVRDALEEKKREVEKLNNELSRYKIELKQHEETIFMHQRLLRIRSELINSLQEKEETNRCRLEDIYSEISKKATLLNQVPFQMENEMSAKTEELQNLFSTLGSKQLEIARKEHIIKMLEENNERNQRLRVKQEEKISRLEKENAELKHYLCKICDMLRNSTLSVYDNYKRDEKRKKSVKNVKNEK